MITKPPLPPHPRAPRAPHSLSAVRAARAVHLALGALAALSAVAALAPARAARAGELLEPHDWVARAEGVARVEVDLKGGAALRGWLGEAPDSAHLTPLAPLERLRGPCAPDAALLKDWLARYPKRAEEGRAWRAALTRGRYTALLALRRVEGEWRATCEVEALASLHWVEHPLHALWEAGLVAALDAREALAIARAPAPREEVRGWHLSAVTLEREGAGGCGAGGCGEGREEGAVASASVALTSAWRDAAEALSSATPAAPAATLAATPAAAPAAAPAVAPATPAVAPAAAPAATPLAAAWGALAAVALGGPEGLRRPVGDLPTCEVVWRRHAGSLRLSRGRGAPVSCAPPPLAAHAAALRALLAAPVALAAPTRLYLSGPLALTLDATWAAEVARGHLRLAGAGALSPHVAYARALDASGALRGWRAVLGALGVTLEGVEAEKHGPLCDALALKPGREARAALKGRPCDALGHGFRLAPAAPAPSPAP